MAGNDSLDVAKLIAEHYQKTYELTYDFWKQRNRLFIYLLIAIGVSTIFTLEEPDEQHAIIALLTGLLGEGFGKYIETLASGGLVFEFLPSILLVVVFFLMFNLYHRTTGVLRLYQYLGGIEDELRSSLGLPTKWIAFTREGNFYWKDREVEKKLRRRLAGMGQNLAKWVYIFLLFALLLAFLCMQGKTDYHRFIAADTSGSALPPSMRIVVVIFDGILALLNILYLISYIAASIKFDREENLSIGETTEATGETHRPT